jgi:hypothetical protein
LENWKIISKNSFFFRFFESQKLTFNKIGLFEKFKVLLDAAVMEMQQYSSVVNRLSVPNRRPQPPPAASAAPSVSTASVPVSAASEAAAAAASATFSSPAETGARPKTTTTSAKPEEKKINNVDKSDKSDKSDKTEKSEKSEATNDAGGQDEVRRRRLEKFAAGAATNNSGSE